MGTSKSNCGVSSVETVFEIGHSTRTWNPTWKKPNRCFSKLIAILVTYGTLTIMSCKAELSM